MNLRPKAYDGKYYVVRIRLVKGGVERDHRLMQSRHADCRGVT